METADHADIEQVEGDDADEVVASDLVEDDAVSDAGTRGSSVAEHDLEEEDEELSDEEITVASVFASEEEEDRNSSNMLNLEEDLGNEEEENNSNTPSIQHENDREVVDVSALLGGKQPRQTGKRTHRDETPSEEERVENDAKAEPKRTRRGLREASARRCPAYLDDYVLNAVQATSRVLDQNGKPIRGSDVRIPRNRREMLRSKWKEFFIMSEMEEMAALKAKGVIHEIPSEEVPKDAIPIKTM